MKNGISVFILLLLSASCDANRTTEINEMEINKPEDLNTVCKNKSIKYFSEKNKKPHDWTSQWRVEENIIDVKGTWKVDDTEYDVMCRIKRGEKETLTVISIEEKKSKNK